MSAQVQSAVEHAARHSFGRLVAWLAWKWGDVAAAEDAMADALAKALANWPASGIPQDPDAWLLTVAKRQLLQAARHHKLAVDPAVTILLEKEQPAANQIPDTRLNLMLVCAHPAIDERIHMPLMLQTVMGLEVSQIAPAMLLAPSTLMQRLVRAKAKIRDHKIRFEVPDISELPSRLQSVLEAIYAAFGLGIDAMDGADTPISGLDTEALFLIELVRQLAPDSAEATGLWALMTFNKARQSARFDALGRFVALQDQDCRLWNRAAILAADQTLWLVAQKRQLGPFQLEAAIQSAHCQRLFTGKTPWAAIAQLYETLNRHYPSVGSLVAGAVATGECGNPSAGLAQLDALDHSLRHSFQAWWVARAHLLWILDNGSGLNRTEIRLAYEKALGLTIDLRLKAHLASKLAQSNGAV
ncbi:MAG: RNA polymerase subunit sigma-70 [Betaproteobacteria bacterium]|nr:MAG: RNA polymerase subunit sigma-70 [Betaproteobacteria bacterium]